MPTNLSQASINEIIAGIIDQNATRVDTVRLHIFSGVISKAIASGTQLNIEDVKQILKKSHTAAKIYEAWVQRIGDIS